MLRRTPIPATCLCGEEGRADPRKVHSGAVRGWPERMRDNEEFNNLRLLPIPATSFCEEEALVHARIEFLGAVSSRRPSSCAITRSSTTCGCYRSLPPRSVRRTHWSTPE